MVGAVGGVQQRLGARGRGAVLAVSAPRPAPGCGSGRPRRSHRARGSPRRRGPRPRNASASRRTWVDLPAPSPPSKTTKTPARVNGSAGDRGRPRIEPHRSARTGDATLVVHLPERADTRPQTPTMPATSSSTRVDETSTRDGRRRRPAASRPAPTEETGERDRQQQDEPGADLHDGEDPAAHLVGDLAAEQGGAGQERHAGARADQHRAEQRHGQVDGQRQEHDGSRWPARCSCRTSGAGTAPGRSSGRARCRCARPMKRVPKSRENAASPALSEAVKNLAVPMTMPAPAKAPKMPSTRPRTSGVVPTYFQPSMNCRNMPWSAPVLAAVAGTLADLLDAEEDDQRGGQPGERVEVERELRRLRPDRQAAAGAGAHDARPGRPGSARPGPG